MSKSSLDKQIKEYQNNMSVEFSNDILLHDLIVEHYELNDKLKEAYFLIDESEKEDKEQDKNVIKLCEKSAQLQEENKKFKKALSYLAKEHEKQDEAWNDGNDDKQDENAVYHRKLARIARRALNNK